MAETASPTTDPADDEKQAAFIRIISIVMAALVAFTLFCMMTARLLGVGALSVADDPILRADVMTRIAPVGSVRTAADAAAEEEAAGATVAASQSAEDIVQGVCASCHLAGVAGAPKLDDEAAWAERRSAGLDALTASVVNGKGAMPARGGTDLSDAELRAAVAHMVGLENDAAEEAADESDNAAASEGDTASEESTESATATESSAADTATAATAATATAATAATATAASDSSDSDATAEQAQNDAGGSEMVAAEASARVKGVVDGICSACHLSGVGGAPKVGDSDTWAARAEKGLAAQVAIVSAGQGAMPARGGSDLSDEEIASAIVYLMSK